MQKVTDSRDGVPYRLISRNCVYRDDEDKTGKDNYSEEFANKHVPSKSEGEIEGAPG